MKIYSAKCCPEPHIVPMGELAEQEIQSRLDRGDAVAVAYSGDEAVGYAWASFNSGLELAFDTTWIVRPGEAVYYGSFTHPRRRGQRVQAHLDAALNCYARQRGVERILASIGAFNRPALGFARHLHKPKVMTVILVRLRGVKWTYRTAIGAALQSRFTAHS